MKQLLSVIILAVILITACTDQSSIVGPNQGKTNNQSLLKLGDRYVQWTSLPAFNSQSLRKEFIDGATIPDATGGTITVNEEYYGTSNQLVKVFSSITFPTNYIDVDDDDANDQTYITMTVDDVTCTSTFTPHMTFYNHPILNARYEGVDLSGIDPSSLEFVYLAEDGTVELMQYESITIDIPSGLLEITNAVIPHFSRYGFINDPPPTDTTIVAN